MITRLATAAIVAILAFDAGSFSVASRTTLAIVVWWTLGLAVLVGALPRQRPQPMSVAIGGFLLAFAALAGLSAAWAPSAEKALVEANRALLYVGVFALVLAIVTRENAEPLSDGIGIGISVVGLAALASRLFPELGASNDLAELLPEARMRLSYPLEYWNGLAILIALGVPLLLRIAAAADQRYWRIGALATLPALGATIFLTSSRGGVAVALLSVGAFLVLVKKRRQALGLIAIAGAGSAAAIAVLFAHPILIDGPFDTSTAESAGRTAAILILGCCAATALLAVALEHLPARRPRIVKLGAAIVATAVVVAFLAAADPIGRVAEASGGSDEWSSVRGHFLNLSDSKRRQLWASAFDQFTDHPLLGAGAGSFEAWWSEHRNVPTFVRDAHSLYLETLGELGLAGFALLAAATVAALAVGIRRVRHANRRERTLVAAATAAFLGFVVAAAEDWMWEMTIVSLVGMALLALLASDSTRPPTSEERAAIPLWARALAATVATVIVAIQGVALLSSMSLKASKVAAARGDMARAIETADRGRALQPWAASPHLQLALVLEETGDLEGAQAEIGRALARDSRDWRLWLVAARIETTQGDIKRARAALREVRRLNPLLPLFTNQ